MDKFQRGHHTHSTPASERTRSRAPTATGDKTIAKKRSSLGRAAGGFQSRLLASLRSRRKSDSNGLAPSSSSSPSRYVPYQIMYHPAVAHYSQAAARF